jgi:hypothetical protein
LRTGAPGMILSRWALHWCQYSVPIVKHRRNQAR